MDKIAPIATQLGIDATFYYIFPLIVVLYFVLSRVYLKPYQNLLDKRRQSIVGVKKEAGDLVVRAEQTFSEYKVRLKDVTDRARSVLREQEEAGRKEESHIIGEAGAKAKSSLQAAQQQIDEQRKAAQVALTGEVSNLANEIAKKVLGA
jgi:F0F1-type ATP synthase membrane subunit b/b'